MADFFNSPIAPPQRYQRPLYRRRVRGWQRGCLGCVIFLSATSTLLSMLCLGGMTLYVASPPATINILVLGVDVRPDQQEEASIARTDSIMVLSINPRKEQVSLFSVPRDVFILTPNFGWLRANTVVRNAELDQAGRGIPEMMESMELTFGIHIDHYMWVNFETFTDVVDALGGIEIEVQERIVDHEYPTFDYGTMRIEFTPGEQTMDGATALIYARTRHGDDDYHRADRQQQVVQALMRELLEPASYPRYPLVWDAFWRNVVTDMEADELMLVAPGLLLYGSNSDSLQRFVIERQHLTRNDFGAVPEMSTITPWIKENME